MVVELGLDELEDLVRRDELAVHAAVVDDLGATRDRRLDLPAHLLDVHLGDDDRAHLLGHALHGLRRERPQRDGPHEADRHALGAQLAHHGHRRAGDGAVGEDRDLGAVHLDLLHAHDGVAVVVDLLAQVPAEVGGRGRVARVGRAAAAVVDQAGHVDLEGRAERRPRQDVVQRARHRVVLVRLAVGRARARRCAASPGSGMTTASRMCPMSASERMMTGVRYCSERLNASTVSV